MGIDRARTRQRRARLLRKYTHPIIYIMAASLVNIYYFMGKDPAASQG